MIILGADEVGTGSWGGPFLVCAVMADSEWAYPGLDDSKKLSKKKREVLSEGMLCEYKRARPNTLSDISAGPFPGNTPFLHYCFGWGWHQEIDRQGMHTTLIEVYQYVLRESMHAIRHMVTMVRKPGASMGNVKIIVDGDLYLGPDVQSIPKADTKFPTVMAASILAKVERDRFMSEEVHRAHPEYGFNQHVGYGTAFHEEAIRRYGPCAAHRMSYQPLKRLVAERASR